MHGDWKCPFSRRLQRKAAERGRRMAKARWALDRERRHRLAALTAEQCPNHIVRRIVVIDGEQSVSETVFWSWDSDREWQRKERNALRQNNPSQFNDAQAVSPPSPALPSTVAIFSS